MDKQQGKQAKSLIVELHQKATTTPVAWLHNRAQPDTIAKLNNQATRKQAGSLYKEREKYKDKLKKQQENKLDS